MTPLAPDDCQINCGKLGEVCLPPLQTLSVVMKLANQLQMSELSRWTATTGGLLSWVQCVITTTHVALGQHMHKAATCNYVMRYSNKIWNWMRCRAEALNIWQPIPKKPMGWDKLIVFLSLFFFFFEIPCSSCPLGEGTRPFPDNDSLPTYTLFCMGDFFLESVSKLSKIILLSRVFHKRDDRRCSLLNV